MQTFAEVNSYVPLDSAEIPLFARLIPLIGAKIPLFGGVAEFAFSSSNINNLGGRIQAAKV
jgi:hypothetical protein